MDSLQPIKNIFYEIYSPQQQTLQNVVSAYRKLSKINNSNEDNKLKQSNNSIYLKN